MAQELVTEPLPIGGSLDQPRDVSHDDRGAVVEVDHAQIRLEGGEGIVGDLGACCTDPCDEGALAHVGESDQRDVGEQLELEPQPLLGDDLTLLGEARGPHRVGQEPGVAPAAGPSLRGEPTLAVDAEIGEDGAVGIAHQRAHRHANDQIVGTGTVSSLSLPVGPAVGSAVRVVSERQQRSDVVVGLQPHRATVPAVAAVGSTFRHVGLATHRHRSGTTVAAFHAETTLVDESGHDCRAYGL